MLYFIDFIDGDRPSRDDEGMEFADLDEACAAAVESLPAIAGDALRGRERITRTMDAGGSCMVAQVRDAADRVLFRARLRLDLDWPARHE